MNVNDPDFLYKLMLRDHFTQFSMGTLLYKLCFLFLPYFLHHQKPLFVSSHLGQCKIETVVYKFNCKNISSENIQRLRFDRSCINDSLSKLIFKDI